MYIACVAYPSIHGLDYEYSFEYGMLAARTNGAWSAV